MKTFKSVFLTVLFILCLLLAACGNGAAAPGSSGTGGSSTANGGKAAEPMEFTRITIQEWGMMASAQAYELLRTDEGARLSFYDGPWEYDDDLEMEDCLRFRIEGDEVFYQELAALAGECGVMKWNGFSKSASGVLDGGGFSMSGELPDGTAISARGSNAYPKGYGDFTNALYDRLRNAAVNDQP